MDDDSVYIEEFLQGKEEGFEMLVRKYQNRILNIVYSLIGNDRESEDIMQEVFLKVYDNVKFFRRQSQFSTWLYRIVINTSYDFLRKRKNTISDDVAFEKNAFTAEKPHDSLLAEERAVILQKALESIPLHFRAALVLKDVDGLSYNEISRVLHCSIGTVESRIYRARQFMREKLLTFKGEIL